MVPVVDTMTAPQTKKKHQYETPRNIATWRNLLTSRLLKEENVNDVTLSAQRLPFDFILNLNGV